jgi:hypothetical protein
MLLNLIAGISSDPQYTLLIFGCPLPKIGSAKFEAKIPAEKSVGQPFSPQEV